MFRFLKIAEFSEKQVFILLLCVSCCFGRLLPWVGLFQNWPTRSQNTVTLSWHVLLARPVSCGSLHSVILSGVSVWAMLVSIYIWLSCQWYIRHCARDPHGHWTAGPIQAITLQLKAYPCSPKHPCNTTQPIPCLRHLRGIQVSSSAGIVSSFSELTSFSCEYTRRQTMACTQFLQYTAYRLLLPSKCSIFHILCNFAGLPSLIVKWKISPRRHDTVWPANKWLAAFESPWPWPTPSIERKKRIEGFDAAAFCRGKRVTFSISGWICVARVALSVPA